MKYLTDLIGIDVTYGEEEKNFPHYILSRYKIRNVLLDHTRVFFLYPKVKLDTVNAILKHISVIQQRENKPVVLVFDKLTARDRSYLLRKKIPFIVDRKQIYLPFFAIYLQEKCDAPEIEKDRFLPSAQMLLLHYIYNNVEELYLSDAAKRLCLTATSIMRAAKQLVELRLFETKKIGVQRVIYSAYEPVKLFMKAQTYMISPVKKVIYVDKKNIDDSFLYAGYSALANYTMINVPNVTCYAMHKQPSTLIDIHTKLMDSELQSKVEIWRYNPSVLSLKDSVDELSLYLTLKNDKDERVEEAAEKLLENVWERLDGNRHS